MAPPLELTSVPVGGDSLRPPADLTGRQWTVLAIGEHATAIAADWAAQIAAHRPDANPRVHLVDDIEAARRALHDDLADAVVGWRLLLAGPAHACLRVRADALEAGAADDEITVASTEVATREIYCAHCRTVTLARIGSPARCPASAAAASCSSTTTCPAGSGPISGSPAGPLPGTS